MILTTPIWRYFIILRLTLDIAYLCKEFDVSSLSHSGNMIGTSTIIMGHVTRITSLSEVVCHLIKELVMASLHIKFGVYLHSLKRNGNAKGRKWGGLGS